LTGLMGANDPQAALASARLFEAASQGGSAALARASMRLPTDAVPHTPALDKLLPNCQINSSPMGADALHGLIDAASKMGDPFGFFNAILEFLKVIAMQGSTDLISAGMDGVETYGQAAEAAFEEM